MRARGWFDPPVRQKRPAAFGGRSSPGTGFGVVRKAIAGSVAAIYQPLPITVGRGNQAANVAAAVTATRKVARSAPAATAPATMMVVVMAAMSTVPAAVSAATQDTDAAPFPRRGSRRRQCSRTESCRRDAYKCEFAKHGHLLKFAARRRRDSRNLAAHEVRPAILNLTVLAGSVSVHVDEIGVSPGSKPWHGLIKSKQGLAGASCGGIGGVMSSIPGGLWYTSLPSHHRAVISAATLPTDLLSKDSYHGD